MIDPETPIPVLRRFNVKTLEQDYDDCTVVASMPLGGMRNPLTGLPSGRRAGHPWSTMSRAGPTLPARPRTVDGLQRIDRRAEP